MEAAGQNNGLDDSISRLSFLAAADDGSGGIGIHLQEYSDLGDHTIVDEAHGETGVDLSYVPQSGDSPAGNDGGDQYTGCSARRHGYWRRRSGSDSPTRSTTPATWEVPRLP